MDENEEEDLLRVLYLSASREGEKPFHPLFSQLPFTRRIHSFLSSYVCGPPIHSSIVVEFFVRSSKSIASIRAIVASNCSLNSQFILTPIQEGKWGPTMDVEICCTILEETIQKPLLFSCSNHCTIYRNSDRWLLLITSNIRTRFTVIISNNRSVQYISLNWSL